MLNVFRSCYLNQWFCKFGYILVQWKRNICPRILSWEVGIDHLRSVEGPVGISVQVECLPHTRNTLDWKFSKIILACIIADVIFLYPDMKCWTTKNLNEVVLTRKTRQYPGIYDKVWENNFPYFLGWCAMSALFISGTLMW